MADFDAYNRKIDKFEESLKRQVEELRRQNLLRLNPDYRSDEQSLRDLGISPA